MGKITSKYQVSIPKALADRLGVRPGDDVEWRVAGDELRVSTARSRKPLSDGERLEMFDAATRRQTVRDKGRTAGERGPRGWKREELYDRGRSR
jgi:AbrB family looped-hinge helix DNA binding protein